MIESLVFMPICESRSFLLGIFSGLFDAGGIGAASGCDIRFEFNPELSNGNRMISSVYLTSTTT